MTKRVSSMHPCSPCLSSESNQRLNCGHQHLVRSIKLQKCMPKSISVRAPGQSKEEKHFNQRVRGCLD